MRAMTLKTCLRCDWEGDTEGAGCPTCGVQLYVLGTPCSAKRTGAPEASVRVNRAIQKKGF